MARLLRASARRGVEAVAVSRLRRRRRPGDPPGPRPGPRDPQRASTSTDSTPAPATARRSTARRACPRRPPGRSASAWWPRSPPGRGTTSSSTPSRGSRPICRRPVLRRRRADLPLGRLAGLARGTEGSRRAARAGRPRRLRGPPGRPGRGARGARRGRPREHAARAVRPGDRRGDGLRPGRDRDAGGGGRRAVRDGEDALGCPPRDPAALALAMARLVADAGLRERLGRAGREAAVGSVRPRPTRRSRGRPCTIEPRRPPPSGPAAR